MKRSFNKKAKHTKYQVCYTHSTILVKDKLNKLSFLENANFYFQYGLNNKIFKFFNDIAYGREAHNIFVRK